MFVSLFSALLFFTVSQGAPILSGLDDTLSPAQRQQQGVIQGDAKDINDSLSCSRSAKDRMFGSQIIAPETLVTLPGRAPVRAKVFISDIANTINRAIEAMAKNGDMEISRRRVCVGLYNYGELNARSYEQGYILVDPIAIYVMQSLPNRSLFSDQQVYLHEFAHQLQYRYGNVYANDPTSRRSELTADCVGAALLALSWKDLSEDILSMESLGVVASAERVGDDDVASATHHGTAEERGRIVKAGFSVVKAHLSLWPSGIGLTSRAILNRCAIIVGNSH